jgi:hypothetical protein
MGPMGVLALSQDYQKPNSDGDGGSAKIALTSSGVIAAH